MSDELNLLPCPFCGSAEVRLIERDDLLDSVMCYECSAEGTATNDKQRAAEYWNRRSPIAAVGGDLPPLPDEEQFGGAFEVEYREVYGMSSADDILEKFPHLDTAHRWWLRGRKSAAVALNRAQQGEPVASGDRREEFEQAMKAKGHRTERTDNGEYVGMTSYRWEGWALAMEKKGKGK